MKQFYKNYLRKDNYPYTFFFLETIEVNYLENNSNSVLHFFIEYFNFINIC